MDKYQELADNQDQMEVDELKLLQMMHYLMKQSCKDRRHGQILE